MESQMFCVYVDDEGGVAIAEITDAGLKQVNENPDEGDDYWGPWEWVPQSDVGKEIQKRVAEFLLGV